MNSHVSTQSSIFFLSRLGNDWLSLIQQIYVYLEIVFTVSTMSRISFLSQENIDSHWLRWLTLICLLIFVKTYSHWLTYWFLLIEIPAYLEKVPVSHVSLQAWLTNAWMTEGASLLVWSCRRQLQTTRGSWAAIIAVIITVSICSIFSFSFQFQISFRLRVLAGEDCEAVKPARAPSTKF